MKPYPFKFAAIIKETIWGGEKISYLKSLSQCFLIGESWEISSVKDNLSVVANGSLKGKTLAEITDLFKENLVGEKCYNLYGTDFPLLIKFIDAGADLSIQVHPDDEFAQKQGLKSGKTELWYVDSCDQNASIVLDFKQNTDSSQVASSVKNGTILELLNDITVEAGDLFFVPAGRVHAIKKGCFILEIQQSSDTTYRLYDYDRKDVNGNKRELHADIALKAIQYNSSLPSKLNYKKIEDASSLIFASKYFSVSMIVVKEGFVRDYSDIDSFIVLVCVKGSSVIVDNNGYEISISHAESILIPASIQSLTFCSEKSDCELIECYL